MSDRGRITVENELLAGGFVQVPICIIATSSLSTGAKMAYGMLLWYAWKTGEYPGHDVACEEFGLSSATLRRYLAELQKAGLISVEVRRLGRTNVYAIHDPLQVLRSEHSICSNLSTTSAQKCTPSPYRNLDSVSDSKNENDSRAYADEVGQRYGTTPADARALAVSLSRYPAQIVEQAVAELEPRVEQVRNPAAWLNAVVSDLHAAEQQAPLPDINGDPGRLKAARTMAAVYRASEPKHEAARLMVVDFGDELARRAAPDLFADR